ncbi:MAG: TolC family protein [Cytophagales bacterium]|nr:TolC family protein [Cytophagales bacterium]
MSFKIFVLFITFPLVTIHAQPTYYTLKQCIETAEKNNLSIKSSELNAKITEKSIELAKANRLPSVSANASQSFNVGRSLNYIDYTYTTEFNRSNNLGINASLVLFNGNNLNHTISQQKLNNAAATYDMEKTKNDIRMSVASAYLQLRMNKEQYKSVQVQIQNTRTQIERAEKMWQSGTATEATVAQIKAQLANEELSLITVENQINTAKLQLTQLMIVPYTTDFEVDTTNISSQVPIDTADTQQIFEKAGQNMPQILSADLRLHATTYAIKSSKSGFYPRLSLNSGISTLYSSLTKLPGTSVEVPFFAQLENFASSYFTLNLSIPIYNVNQTRINVSRSTINRDIALNNKAIAKNQLRQDIENAFNNYRAADKKLNASSIQVASRKLSYDFAERRYTAGTMSNFEFINEKNNLLRAELDKIQAEYEKTFRKKMLDFYYGKPLYE